MHPYARGLQEHHRIHLNQPAVASSVCSSQSLYTWTWNLRMSFTICIITRITSPEILYNIIFFKFLPSFAMMNVRITILHRRVVVSDIHEQRIQLVVRPLFNTIRYFSPLLRGLLWISSMFHAQICGYSVISCEAPRIYTEAPDVDRSIFKKNQNKLFQFL